MSCLFTGHLHSLSVASAAAAALTFFTALKMGLNWLSRPGSSSPLQSADLHTVSEILFDAKPPFYRFVADSQKRSSASMAREWLPRLIRRRIGR